MPDVLDFNPERKLGFDPDRPLEFDAYHDLDFVPTRALDFDPDRELGFGKKGVVFRGYVCPVCGAAVTEDQATCTGCGAVFEVRTPPKAPPKPAPKAMAPPPPPREPWAPWMPPPPEMPPPPKIPQARPPPPPPPTRAPPVSAYPSVPKRIDVHNCDHCGALVSTTDEFCSRCGNRIYRGPG